MRPFTVRRCGLAALALAVLATAPADAAKPKPDLVVTEVTAPATGAPGESIALTDTVKNKGKKRSGRSVTGFFLSTDQTKDDSDVQITPGHTVGRLKPGKSATAAGLPAVPESIETGTYTVIACADVDKQVREKRESNNCRAQAGTTAIVDDTAPAAPSGLATTPAGPANDNAPQLTGNAEDSTVRLYGGPGCSGAVLDAATAANNDFAFTLDVDDDSTNTFSATAVDDSDNESSCSPAVTYIEDSTAPATPSGLLTAPVSPAHDASPHLKGAAENGSTITVYKTSNCTGTAAASALASGGAFDIQVAVAVDSSTTLSATAADTAGNVSLCSSPVTYVHSTLPSETEPNGTFGTATPMPLAGEIQGAITDNGDLDYFSFAIPAGPNRSVRVETFKLDGTPCLPGPDTSIELRAADGTTVLAANDDKGAGDHCSKIGGTSPPASNLAPGTYYVMVGHALPNQLFSYELEVALGPAVA